MSSSNLSDAAKEARNAYRREYYKRNREKEIARQNAFWERKAKEFQQQKEEEVNNATP